MMFHVRMQANLKHGYFADYIGFTIPNVWVVGFGTDYNQHFRDIAHLVTLNKHGIDYFSAEAIEARNKQ